MFWNWFKSKVGKLSALDQFRIKIITLNNGKSKYYPQFKDGDMTSEWLCIITLKENYILVDVSEYDLINSSYYYKETLEEADTVIENYKIQLSQERANNFKSEKIIKR